MSLPDRWLWPGLSVLLAGVATQFAWHFWHWPKGRAWAERLETAGILPPLIHLVRFFYYIGLPFGALLWGQEAILERAFGLWPLPLLFGTSISPEELLLAWTQWTQGIGWAVFLGITSWGLLALSGWMERGHHWVELRMGPWASLREAIFHEVHWMFYRNGPVVALGPYWGTWAGLGIVLLEAALNPWWHRALRRPDQRPLALLRMMMAPLSAFLYLQASNLWLAILLHWGITWGMVAWMNRLARRTARQTCSK
ncbi:MAG: hypothetical protein RMK65_07260 [Anaerolineae bacterium]|nr:hypothetical protein [Anaerolineae bacterium]MCX8067998.1 hypothetical protein [Anaerolineae bacterium]MDW7991916.1 hypothetical protein [Anaerolineae bacterium]